MAAAANRGRGAPGGPGGGGRGGGRGGYVFLFIVLSVWKQALEIKGNEGEIVLRPS